MLVCFAFMFVLSLALRYYLVWENRRRDRAGHVDSGGISFEGDTLDAAVLDKTDKELLQFRYVY